MLPAGRRMGEPKLVRGMLGWAAIGDGLIVYAKTKAEARRRFRAAQEAESQPPETRAEHVDPAFPECHPEKPKATKNLPRTR
jgi:hypothetical protein